MQNRFLVNVDSDINFVQLSFMTTDGWMGVGASFVAIKCNTQFFQFDIFEV